MTRAQSLELAHLIDAAGFTFHDGYIYSGDQPLERANLHLDWPFHKLVHHYTNLHEMMVAPLDELLRFRDPDDTEEWVYAI